MLNQFGRHAYNGTVINGKKIDTPKSFQVACTVTTQIIAQVASGQYGGQSINGIDRILAPFVRKSYEKSLTMLLKNKVEIYGMEPNMEKAREIAWNRTRKEVKDGIQTIQYQINTLMTTNGQSPFVTLLCISNLITNTLRKQLSLLKRFYVNVLKA